MRPVDVEIIRTSSCPHGQAVRQRIESLARDEGIMLEVTETTIDDPAEARARRIPGSPTVLVKGTDVDPRAASAPADYGLG